MDKLSHAVNADDAEKNYHQQEKNRPDPSLFPISSFIVRHDLILKELSLLLEKILLSASYDRLRVLFLKQISPFYLALFRNRLEI